MPTTQPGLVLSHYRLVEKIGEGGMGAVWKALDTSLNRHVALKLLPAELTADPERRQRFVREARAAAAVTHPNIASVHEIGEADGITFICMELVEGRTLRTFIGGRPLPVADAVRITIEIAAGLARAHGARIVHRDLKPENIIIGADGHPRILDFGLARLVEPQHEKLPSPLSQLDTRAEELTHEGRILGTTAYMSPEQARGEAVDARSDIFSFGCVLYECLTGRSPFLRSTSSDTLSAVLTIEPDWGALPVTLSRRVDDVLRRCLRKDPHRRLQDMADVRIELEEAQSEAGETETRSPRPISTAHPSWTRLPWAIGGLLVGILIGSQAGGHRPPVLGPSPPMMRATLELPPGVMSGPLWRRSVAFSADGRSVVFRLDTKEGARLYRRALDSTGVEALPGTDDGFGPFSSTDGQWMAFFTPTHLLKVSTAGGTPLKLCEVSPVTAGGTWTSEGIIYAHNYNGGLWLVPESGGEPQRVTQLEKGEHAHLYPQALPGGWLLFTAVVGQDFQDHASSRILAFNPGTAIGA